MTKQVLILNGPNLNLLGQREPGHYGAMTLDQLVAECMAFGEELGMQVEAYQSNNEGDLVSKLQEAGANNVGVVFNPGAYSHTSIALRDAISGAQVNVIEVHISNIHAREEFRHLSLVSAVAKGVIAGLGTDGYLLAMRAISKNMGE